MAARAASASWAAMASTMFSCSAFTRLQREELACAAGGEQGRGAVGLQPLQPVGIGLGGKAQLGVEVGQREGQQTRLQDLFEFLGGHGRSPEGVSDG